MARIIPKFQVVLDRCSVLPISFVLGRNVYLSFFYNNHRTQQATLFVYGYLTMLSV